MIRIKWFECMNSDGGVCLSGFVGKVEFFTISKMCDSDRSFILDPGIPVAWEVDDFDAHSDGYSIAEAKAEAHRILKSWLIRTGLNK